MFFRRKEWPFVPFEEIRKRSRLLVIDDQDFPYQALFIRDGYNIEKGSDVETLTGVQDGKYDLLLLDLQGVGRKESVGLAVPAAERGVRP